MKDFTKNKQKEFEFIGLSEKNIKTHFLHYGIYFRDFFKKPRFKFYGYKWPNKVNISTWDNDEIVQHQKNNWSNVLNSFKMDCNYTKEIWTNNLYNNFINTLYHTRFSKDKKKIRILDYGGGFGLYKFIITTFTPEIDFEYYIYDLPNISKIGKELNPDINFIKKEECFLDTYDLIIFSGSLCYIENWKNTLADACKCAETNIYVAKQSFVNTARSFCVMDQNYHYKKSGLPIPMWWINMQEMIQICNENNFKKFNQLYNGHLPQYVYNAPEQASQIKTLLFTKY
jgi:putative methyltransferase (TIGR04325 family)